MTWTAIFERPKSQLPLAGAHNVEWVVFTFEAEGFDVAEKEARKRAEPLNDPNLKLVSLSPGKIPPAPDWSITRALLKDAIERGLK